MEEYSGIEIPARSSPTVRTLRLIRFFEAGHYQKTVSIREKRHIPNKLRLTIAPESTAPIIGIDGLGFLEPV